MTTHDGDARFDGRSIRIIVQGRVLPLESAVFPEDFPKRLVRLKEAAGLTWTAFARVLGVDHKQVRRWREGVEPAGGAMFSLFRFAMRLPKGVEILMGKGFRVVFWETED